LKENVIVGKKIPAGTGLRQFKELLVTGESLTGGREEEEEALVDQLQ
jgi:hypothetical protein